MSAVYLFVVGVNFDATVLDTQDLSTIRGSGLALLWAPGAVAQHLEHEWLPRHAPAGKVEVIRRGASEGLLLVRGVEAETLTAAVRDFLSFGGSCPADEDTTKPIMPPWQHLVFTVGTAPCSALERFRFESEQAIAAARANQYRSLTMPLPETVDEKGKASLLPCKRQRILPATVVRPYRGDRDENNQPVEYNLSASLFHRHMYGKAMRRKFYGDELDWRKQPDEPGALRTAKAGYTDSFAELVDKEAKATPKHPLRPTLDPALAEALPVAVEQKMAVMTFDGNGFGELFAKTHEAKALHDLSEELTRKRRSLLRALFEAFENDRPRGIWRYDPKSEVHANRPADQLRFETLLWGGEEMTFVCPGWAALEVMALIQAHLCDPAIWTVEVNGQKHVLSHAGGMVVCHHKTPIRLVKQLADKLAEAAKKEAKKDRKEAKQDGPCYPNTFQMMFLEGIDVPPEELSAQRARVALAPEKNAQGPLFTFGGKTWPDVLDGLDGLKKRKGKLARSQAYRLLDRGMERFRSGGVLDDNWREEAARLFDGRAKQTPELGEAALNEATKGLPGAGTIYGLQHLVALWDYIDPFALEPR